MFVNIVLITEPEWTGRERQFFLILTIYQGEHPIQIRGNRSDVSIAMIIECSSILGGIVLLKCQSPLDK